MERRLAAILAADIVGYSKLMAEDEEATLAMLKAHRADLFDPKIAEHNGRIIKLMGDGTLVEFASVVDAVNCAISIQSALTSGNSEVSLRIGVNIGDVIAEGDDIYGDGVNVAARLEGIADPGGIALSAAAYEQVGDRVKVHFSDLGPQDLKNIPLPVHVYAVNLGGQISTPSVRPPLGRKAIVAVTFAALILAGSAAVWWLKPWSTSSTLPQHPEVAAADQNGKPSIAVLPFANRSDDRSKDYFSDGLTEDLITDLSKVSGLFVIARGSSFQYRNRDLDILKVGQELRVSHMLTGSVRKAGGLVRINAQLIEVKSGKHVWGARYDGELSEVFTLQDQVTEKIVSALKVKLSDDEKLTIRRPYTKSVEAYDEFLKGRSEFGRFNRGGNLASRAFFERAIKLDPKFTDAYALLAWSYMRGYSFGWDDAPEASLQKALDLARQAMVLDDQNSVPYLVLGAIQLYRMKHSEAVALVERSLELNPNYSDGHAMLAFILNYSGFPEKGVELVSEGMRLNPHFSYMYLMVLGQSRFMQGKYDQAAELFSEAAARNPVDTQVTMWLAASKALAGQVDDAQWNISELLAQNENYTIRSVVSRLPIKNQNQVARLEEGLRKAGLPD